jgi:murein DD-endopeptidase MepM/ murein hydrolase activator NlpD
MLDVRSKVVRRWAAAVTAIAVATVPTSASAAPDAPAAPTAPAQTEPTTDERSPDSDDTLVDVDVLVSTNAAAVATTLDELGTEINDQLTAFNTAQAAVATATADLATADAALSETRFLIEETTTASDEVVIDAFINPPSESSLDVLSADSLTEATVKQTLLGMEADRSAASLTDLEAALAEYETLEAEQEEAREAADTAKGDAEASLADLDAALSAQARFATAVQEALAEQAGQPAPTDPAEAQALMARQAEIASAITVAAEARAAAEAARAAEEERRRKVEAGLMFCPVEPATATNFIDSWGFSRSGGRAHKGVDMMAAHGVETVAPVSGRVEHRGTSLGGLSWYVYGDNGNTYYGTHLQSYANQGVGWVEAGTVIGYVGSSGNASSSGPHLHFEIHPGGGSPINPYPLTHAACPGHD